MHKEGYLGIVWGIFLMCHFQHAAKFFPLCSCYYLEEQVEVIWQFDTQTVLHTHKSHRISQFVGLLHFSSFLYAVTGLDKSIGLTFGACRHQASPVTASRFGIWETVTIQSPFWFLHFNFRVPFLTKAYSGELVGDIHLNKSRWINPNIMLCNGYEYFLNISVEPYGYAVFRIQLVPVVVGLHV